MPIEDEMKLKPCPLPWCKVGEPMPDAVWGPSAVYDPDEPTPAVMNKDSFDKPCWWVRCRTCGLDSASYPTEAEAITAWNTRKSATND